MTALVWLLAFVVAGLALLVVGLLRSHATILRALHDAGIDLDPDRDGGDSHDDHGDLRTMAGVPGPAGASGRRADDVAGTTPAGGTRSVRVTGGDEATLLAFLTTGCSTCAGFWTAFAAGVDLPSGVRLVVVTKGPEHESPAAVAELAPAGFVTVQSSRAWSDYRIPAAPYFVLIEPGRGVVVGEGAAASWDRVADLLRRSLADTGRGSTIDRRDLLSGRTRPDPER